MLASTPILDRLSTLGDETRIRILALLREGELTVGELRTALQLPQPTVSRHLRTLASEGWVEARAEGRNRHYRLSAEIEPAARSLWEIVHGELERSGRLAGDAERARAVLSRRRLRSSAFFAESAQSWDTLRGELFGSATGLAPLLGLLDSAWTVADLGVGTGALVERISPFVERVIGVDGSAQMLAAARARLATRDNVDLREGELESLPLDDSSVDVAILALVLHYVVDPPAVLAEARRVLVPGGRLLVVDMRPHERGHEYAEGMGHVWAGFALDRFDGWLTDAGFANLRVGPLPPDPEATGPLLFLASGTA